MIGCSGCKAKDQEIARITVEKKEIMDRMLAMLGQFQATSEALSAATLNEPEKTGVETEADAIAEEEDATRRLDEEAQAEIERFAQARGVPSEAFRDL